MTHTADTFNWLAHRYVTVFACFFLVCAVLISVAAPYRASIGSDPLAGDGFYYFSYSRSILFDADVNFRNEYSEFAPEGKVIIQRSADGSLRPSTGEFEDYPDNFFAIGIALLWLPFLAICHLTMVALASLGIETAALTGFSLPYLISAAIGTCFYGFLGTLLLHRSLTTSFRAPVAFVATSLVLTGTALINYIIIDPFYSHVGDFFACALIIYVCATYPQIGDCSYRQVLVLGLTIGLATLIRWQLVLVGLIVFVDWLRALPDIREYRVHATKALLIVFGALIVFSPQVLAWQAIYDQFLVVPQGGGFFTLRIWGWLDVLFSRHGGMFYWHPITLVACLGLIWGGLKFPHGDSRRWMLISGAAIVVLQIFINASVADVDAGVTFGMRRMIGFYPILAWGLATVIAELHASKVYFIGSTTWVVITTWNALLLVIWTLRMSVEYFPR